MSPASPAEQKPRAPFLGLHNFVVLRDQQPLFIPVSFDLLPGQSLQISAANGGGKTTLLRCLYGLAIDHQGEVRLQGRQAAIAALRTYSVYMNDRAGVYGHLTAEENLHYMLLLHGITPDREACNRELQRFGLAEKKRLLAHRLSKGQKKRLHLARLSMLGKPLWLLDEPFDGLDARGRELLCALLGEHTAKGGVVIFSSHMDAQTTYQSHLMLELTEWDR